MTSASNPEPLAGLCRAARALALGLAALAGLEGCTLDTGSPGGPQRWVPEEIKVAGGAVTVRGPTGYCVDTSASRDGQKGAFVLLGSCASLQGKSSGKRPANAAVLTAAVSSRGSDATPFRSTFQAMTGFLASKAGRTALSRNRHPDSVRILAAVADGDVLYIHATDTAPARGQRLEADYWRALMAVHGQIVTLTVLGLKDMPLGSEVKRAILKNFAAAIGARNAG